MKRALPIIVSMLVSGLVGWTVRGWLGHYDDTSPIQSKFVAAAQCGNVGQMQALSLLGAQVDDLPTASESGAQGYTALFVAADAGQADAVRWLLDHGADPNHDTGDARPLGAATHRAIKATEAAELLKAHGAK